MKESNFERITGMDNIVYSITLYSIGVFGLGLKLYKKNNGGN